MQDSLVLEWAEERVHAICSLENTEQAEHANFTSQEAKTLPLSIVAYVSKNPQYPSSVLQMATEMLQLRAFVLVVKKEWRLCFQAQKHRLLQYSDHSPDISNLWNVCSIRSLQKCLLIIEFLQKWNNSSYCFSHKRDHCASATFPQHVSVGGHFNNKGSSRVQTDFHCYSPKIWGFFKEVPPTEQLCLNSRLALSYQSCGERRAEGKGVRNGGGKRREATKEIRALNQK